MDKTLTNFSVQNCTRLWFLNIINNNISTFTSTGSSNIADFFITNNNLYTLDMSGMKSTMLRAYVNKNHLTWANVRFPANGFSSMLDISENPLGILDLTGITILGKLRAQYTGINIFI